MKYLILLGLLLIGCDTNDEKVFELDSRVSKIEMTIINMNNLVSSIKQIEAKNKEAEGKAAIEESKRQVVKLCRQVSRELHNGKFEIGKRSDNQQPTCLITKRGQVIELWESELKRIKQLLD